MPLKTHPEKKSPVTNDSTDTGYESLGLEESDLNELQGDDDNDEEETDEWLQNIGIEQTEIKKFNNSQVGYSVRVSLKLVSFFSVQCTSVLCRLM